jgi:integrase
MSVETVRRKGGNKKAYKVGFRDHAKRQRWETYSLKADADKRDAEIKSAKQRGEPIPKRGKGDAGETFEAFAYESWWPNYVQANKMVEKTQERYATFLDKHLIPRIGDEAITHITVERVLEVKSSLAADKVPDYTSARSLKLLRQILTFAQVMGKIETNPADIFGHKGMLPSQKREEDIRPLLANEVEAIRASMLKSESPHAQRNATLVSVMAYAGLRPGEALGLVWENVRKDSLRIVQRVSGGATAPNTKTGDRRTVPSLIKPLTEDLASWKKAAPSRASKALVFPADGGEPWSVTAYGNWRSRAWKDAAPSENIPYDLRHGYSLMLAIEGVQSADVAKRMGHTLTTHSQHYEHFLDELRGKPRKSMQAQVKAARSRPTRRRSAGNN